jgi:hypothetical protein
MTVTLPRSDDINDPIAGATRAAMPCIEIATDATVIAVGDDIKGTFLISARELPPSRPRHSLIDRI